jgi:hypothetical protein
VFEVNPRLSDRAAGRRVDVVPVLQVPITFSMLV